MVAPDKIERNLDIIQERCELLGAVLVTRSPSDGIPLEMRLLELVLDEAVGRVLYHFK